MIRACIPALLLVALISSMAQAQDGATRRATRVIHAQEKEILRRITQRLEFDKKLDGSTVKVEVLAGGAVTLSGSVPNERARAWVVELVENTTGVNTVVDELAVAKGSRVYDANTGTPVVEVGKPIVVPSESRVIVKP